MKQLILIIFLATIGSIIAGFTLDVPYAEKLIGFGVISLFVIVFPLFSYYRWKDKKLEDYMLTKENLEKMRKREGNARKL
ncbi:hypothetical protein [Oceanihabitans sediminis]|uniref:hypothetical protein n=1 Tax=Oceanihabitans sediminis TaxID=1812012 RepID=UPI003A93F4BC